MASSNVGTAHGLKSRQAPSAAVEALHEALNYKPKKASKEETRVYALTAAHQAHGLLLKDRVPEAEALLRDGLTGRAPLSAAERSCLLNDYALCAMHDDRPADAATSLRHALDVLPAAPLTSMPADAWERSKRSVPAVGERGLAAQTACESWVLRMRAQLHLNLCEALLLLRRLDESRQSAQEAVRLAQLGLASWEDTTAGPSTAQAAAAAAAQGARRAAAAKSAAAAAAIATAAAAGSSRQHGAQLGASTPRLLAARWLLPSPDAPPRENQAELEAAAGGGGGGGAGGGASAGGGGGAYGSWPLPTGVPPPGCLPCGAALTLGWLWCALSEEGLGLAKASLNSFRSALDVAHTDRAGTARLVEQLRKKVGGSRSPHELS